MEFGLAIFPTEYTMQPPDLGRLAEQRGFDSLYFPEHTHIPVTSDPFPAGGEIPRHYRDTYDPFVALAAVAAVTTRLKLGFGICLIIQRDPIVTAKEVATLDVLSHGRVTFGVGAGWNKPEVANHGVGPGRRFGVMRERVGAMKAIWTQDEASYHGRHVDFDAIWSWPKPVQKPHPPVLVAGVGPKVLDRVLAYGDGWIPNRPWDLADRIAELRRRGADAGRGHIPVTYFAPKPDAETVEEIVSAGVDEVVIMLPSREPGEVERRADEAAALTERFR